MRQLSLDEQTEINDDFLRENFWSEDAFWQLGTCIAFYFKFGRFLGSQKLVPKVNLSCFYFLKHLLQFMLWML